MASRPELQKLGLRKTDHGRRAIGAKKTDNGKIELYSAGGAMKESKAMDFKHAMAMKKAGVPKKMVKEELAEAKTAKFAKGGGVESKGKTKGKTVTMKRGGRC